MLVGCIERPIDCEVIKRRHTHLLSLAKDVKLEKIHRSDRELNPGPSHGIPLRYRCATQAPPEKKTTNICTGQTFVIMAQPNTDQIYSHERIIHVWGFFTQHTPLCVRPALFAIYV